MVVLVVAGLGSPETVENPVARTLLDKLSKLKASVESEADAEAAEGEAAAPSASAADADANAGAFFEDSRIGQLAREITSKIDMSSLAAQRPEDLMNMQNLFSGSNSAITNIIQQVGSTITEKIQKGELRQEELVSDAMALMSKMNLGGMMGGKGGAGGPGQAGMGDMMKNMMSMFGGMAGGGAQRAPRRGRETREDMRARLQKKMAVRGAAQGSDGGSAPADDADSSFTQ
jgi:hypothetical protein